MLKCEVMYRSAPCPVIVALKDQDHPYKSELLPGHARLMSPVDQAIGIDQPIEPVAVTVGGSCAIKIANETIHADQARVTHIAEHYLVIRVGSIEFHVSTDPISTPVEVKSWGRHES
jgi:hypothetical protein